VEGASSGTAGFPTWRSIFLLKDGELIPDPFVDDQALVVDTPDGAIVMTGCAHSGLVNILKHVLEKHRRVTAVVGGTYLGIGAPISKVEATTDFLDEVLPYKIIANPCTGSVVMSRILDRFKDRFIPCQTGFVTNL